MQVPFMVLLALFALGAGVYGVANYWGPEFGIMVVVYMVTLWTFESIAQFLSALFHNPLLGMLVFICVW
jgi:ABC-type transport system involved in multi-copper enzyme maturation permease subunit